MLLGTIHVAWSKGKKWVTQQCNCVDGSCVLAAAGFCASCARYFQRESNTEKAAKKRGNAVTYFATCAASNQVHAFC